MEQGVPKSKRFELDIAGLTHTGQLREQNEDQFLIATLQRSLVINASSLDEDASRWLPKNAEGTILAVADGMGGIEGGAKASSLAVRTIADYLCNVLPWAAASKRKKKRSGTLPGVRLGLQAALEAGDAQVREAADEDEPEMGTTLTMAYVLWPHLYVAHAGDSRCYLYRLGRLAQITTDHTVAAKLREIQALEVDDDSPWHHALWNVLGGGDETAMEPEVRRHMMRPDDIVLLCSDGLTKHLSDADIEDVLKSVPTAREACAMLVAQANANGGSDNVTVVVARQRPARGA